MPSPISLAPASWTCGSLKTTGSVSILAPPHRSWTTSSATSWITIVSGGKGQGDGLVTFHLGTNTGHERQGSIDVTFVGSAPRSVQVTQASGHRVLFQKEQVMKAPMIMELGVAGKFLGKELQKIPLPYREAAIAVVVGLVEALGPVAIAARHAFPAVPEPPDYYYPEDPDPGGGVIPMTDQFIEKQIQGLAAYITEVANE